MWRRAAWRGVVARGREGGTRKRGEGEEGGVYRPAHFPVSFPRPSPPMPACDLRFLSTNLCVKRVCQAPEASDGYPLGRTSNETRKQSQGKRFNGVTQHKHAARRWTRLKETFQRPQILPQHHELDKIHPGGVYGWQSGRGGGEGGGDMPKATDPRGSSGG